MIDSYNFFLKKKKKNLLQFTYFCLGWGTFMCFVFMYTQIGIEILCYS